MFDVIVVDKIPKLNKRIAGDMTVLELFKNTGAKQVIRCDVEINTPDEAMAPDIFFISEVKYFDFVYTDKCLYVWLS